MLSRTSKIDLTTTSGNQSSPRYFPKNVLAAEFNPKRKLAHFLLELHNVPGALESSASLTSKSGVNIFSGFHHAPSTSDRAIWSFFADFTNARLTPDQLVSEFRSLPVVADAHFQLPSGGLLVDSFHFPLEWGGQRAVMIRAEVLGSIFARVNEIFGEGAAAGVLLFEMGEAAGRSAYNRIKTVIGEDAIRKEINQLVSLYRSVGWGILALRQLDYEKQIAEVQVEDSFECSHYKGTSSVPKSHFIRGVMAAWLSELFGKRVKVAETSCIAMGNEFCLFKADAS